MFCIVATVIALATVAISNSITDKRDTQASSEQIAVQQAAKAHSGKRSADEQARYEKQVKLQEGWWARADKQFDRADSNIKGLDAFSRREEVSNRLKEANLRREEAVPGELERRLTATSSTNM